jgi:hypothetical protein
LWGWGARGERGGSGGSGGRGGSGVWLWLWLRGQSHWGDVGAAGVCGGWHRGPRLGGPWGGLGFKVQGSVDRGRWL